MPYQSSRLLERSYHSAHPARTLIQLLAISPLQLAAYMLVFLIKNAPLMAIPLYLEWVVGWAESSERASDGWFFAVNGGFVLLCLQNVWTHQWFVVLTHRHVRQMERNLRGALVRRLQQLSIAWHVRFESGRLQSKVLRDVDSVVQMATQVFHSGIAVIVLLGCKPE